MPLVEAKWVWVQIYSFQILRLSCLINMTWNLSANKGKKVISTEWIVFPDLLLFLSSCLAKVVGSCREWKKHFLVSLAQAPKISPDMGVPASSGENVKPIVQVRCAGVSEVNPPLSTKRPQCSYLIHRYEEMSVGLSVAQLLWMNIPVLIAWYPTKNPVPPPPAPSFRSEQN